MKNTAAMKPPRLQLATRRQVITQYIRYGPVVRTMDEYVKSIADMNNDSANGTATDLDLNMREVLQHSRQIRPLLEWPGM